MALLRTVSRPNVWRDDMTTNILWGVVREGKIEPLDHIDLPEGARVLITLVEDEDSSFWMQASQVSLDKVWNNAEDDVYAQLLEE